MVLRRRHGLSGQERLTRRDARLTKASPLAPIGRFSAKRARQTPLSRAFRRGDQRQIDNIALCVAAADPGRVIADRQDRFDGALVVIGRESKHAIDEAPANFGSHLPVLA